MPHRPSKADVEYAARALKVRVGRMTAREWDATCATTAAGALVRAAAWRQALAASIAGEDAIPRSWCLAAHARCIADAQQLREREASRAA